MASNAEFFMSYAVVPDAAERSHIEIRIRAEPAADGAALVAAARSFIDEDVDACERIQAALHSPWFEVGPLAQRHEAPITAFQRNLLELLDETCPGRFVGAWEREALEIGGAPVAGIGRALWIEAGGTYVDVRAPGSVASGHELRRTQHLAGADVHLASRSRPAPAAGKPSTAASSSVDDDLIIERGSGIDGGTARTRNAGGACPTADGSTAIATTATGLAVRVGDSRGARVRAAGTRVVGARAWQCRRRLEVRSSRSVRRSIARPDASGWSLTANGPRPIYEHDARIGDGLEDVDDRVDRSRRPRRATP